MPVSRFSSRSFLPRLAIAVVSFCIVLLFTLHYQEDIRSSWLAGQDDDEVSPGLTADSFHESTDEEEPWLPSKPANMSRIRKAVVVPIVEMSAMRWMQDSRHLLHDHQWIVYCMDKDHNRPECHIPRTVEGREAAAYLSYILDYYDDLPRYSIFIHTGGDQWHNDMLAGATHHLFQFFRYEAVDKLGFVNTRCTHDPGCPKFLKPHEEAEIAPTTDIKRWYKGAYEHLFNATSEEVPETVGAVCCAQFIVSRTQIRKRPKADYERMLQWLAADHDHLDTHDKGWYFETLWHHIFGREALYCPRYEQCRCDMYGWCGPIPETGEILKAAGGSRW